MLVAVAGIEALGKPIGEIAHRPELVSAILGLHSEEPLTPEALAQLLTSPHGGMKNATQAARAAVLINKVESIPQWEAARRTARCILHEPLVERVAIGALKGRDASEGWEVWTRHGSGTI